MNRSRFSALLALLLFPVLLSAQSSKAPVIKGFRAEFLASLDEVEGKIMELAEQVPADRYGWRPAPDVRSIAEVYTHIAGSNYFLATFAGVKAPATMPTDFEKITDKQRILTELRKSFEHVRTAVKSAKDADLETSVKLFGTNTSRRGVYMTIMNHLHEHLGQSIAYARMNGVVPPWSR
jgi:uncharacterized damage-inducible protein DinB